MEGSNGESECDAFEQYYLDRQDALQNSAVQKKEQNTLEYSNEHLQIQAEEIYLRSIPNQALPKMKPIPTPNGQRQVERRNLENDESLESNTSINSSTKRRRHDE
ncbi:hypothetical protein TBLA_0F02810 [Henningerozyma blattae CBS 6284]|uniref:Uncharacterized protein n=1 Tax=Henningerozyma blattae (strain ATCC 34711 / CBS 6284 / DSM 70876 / NBRC 10599 / NRRL Y-10934 / UCD 77-7) TaxID=1071380 RepID=I2H618_HENB6|nr:hypothetical protein TBLA_0F02810 [Tetrapisispora blattae CBS 6284]CCH61820.1 hypothetical protein TBLA_0F02810 [Tetrapisispora blattae CBS 6284]